LLVCVLRRPVCFRSMKTGSPSIQPNGPLASIRPAPRSGSCPLRTAAPRSNCRCEAHASLAVPHRSGGASVAAATPRRSRRVERIATFEFVARSALAGLRSAALVGTVCRGASVRKTMERVRVPELVVFRRRIGAGRFGVAGNKHPSQLFAWTRPRALFRIQIPAGHPSRRSAWGGAPRPCHARQQSRSLRIDSGAPGGHCQRSTANEPFRDAARGRRELLRSTGRWQLMLNYSA